MKKLRTFFLVAITAIMGGTMTSCNDYQNDIDALDKRVYRLEHLVDSINKNLDGLAMLINAQADGWLITGMAELPDGNGYIVNFGKLDKTTGKLSTKPEDKKTITIYNGLDANAPDLSVRYDPTDGNYYWVVNGTWVLDPDGNRIRVNGKDGKDGKDGQDGKDGSSTAPKVRINDYGYWEMSTDDGETWQIMTDSNGNPIKATGKDGKDGKDGEDGKDGKDGKDGADGQDGKDGKNGNDAAIIISKVVIEVDANGNRYIVFTLKGAGGNGEDIEVRTQIMDGIS